MYKWTKKQQTDAKKDFRVFLYIVWAELGLPDPTEIQRDMAYTLQHPPGDRFIMQGFRGVAKSFITCAFAAWQLYNNPQLKVLIVSASKSRADDNAIFIKKILQMVHFLNPLLPGKDQRDTQNVFDVAPAKPDISPSVKSVGITGQITGTRADVLISDDVEIPNNSGTQLQRSKLSEAVKEYDSIIKPGGTIIYLGTPQSEMSIYNELQATRGYKCVIYPIVYPETKTIRNYYGGRLAKVVAERYDSDPERYAGKPTDPKRFDASEIAKRRMANGKAGFALQFLLYTNLSDIEKYPLKLSDLIVEDLDIFKSSTKWAWATGPAQRIQDLPGDMGVVKNDLFYAPLDRSKETKPYVFSTMFIDPSGRGADQTAYAIAGYLNGYIFLLDCDGYTGGYTDDTLRNLATKAKVFGCQKCIIEPNFGNGMFAELMRPVMRQIAPMCSVEDGKPARTQKEARIIDTLEPVMMSHKLIVNKAIIENDYRYWDTGEKDYSLFYQMTRLCREKGALAHDDKIDALEGVVSYYRELMEQEENVLTEDELLDDWFDALCEEGLQSVLPQKNYVPKDRLMMKNKGNEFRTGGGFYNSMSGYLFRK